MKPATLALLTFLISLGVYSIIGVQIVFLIPILSPTPASVGLEASLVISTILAILTALFVYRFERQ